MKAQAQSAHIPTLIEPLGPKDVVHQGKLIQVYEQRVRLPNGHETRFEVARRPPGVRVIATTDRSVLLNKEWRHEHNSWDYRLPGGKVVDDFASFEALMLEKDELFALAMRAAARELEEETGIVDFKDLRLLHVSSCGATVEWDLYYFTVTVESEHLPSRPCITAEGECVVPAFYAFDTAMELFREGFILEDRSASTLLRYLLARSA